MAATLISLGFESCATAPGLFRQVERGILLACHVDDVLASATPQQLTWLRTELSSRYELKSDLLGESYAKCGKFLKRSIVWTGEGIVWSPDAKHAHDVIQEWSSGSSRHCALPVGPEANKPSTGDALSASNATSFRSAAAKIQYLSHDRADLGLPATILASKMSMPHESDRLILRRVADYLRSNPALNLLFKWQQPPENFELTVFTDSDWAACESTRRSRSGGVILLNNHIVQHFCRMQDTIALSSGEAELKATCKGLTEALGLRNVVEFLFNRKCRITHATDASACVGMLKRSGAGKVKHLSVRQLWCQEVFRREDACTTKVARADNPADLMCSTQNKDGLTQKLADLGFVATAHGSEGGKTCSPPLWPDSVFLVSRFITDVRRSDGLNPCGLDVSDALSTVETNFVCHRRQTV